MPLVFVHGVSVRSGPGYFENVTLRDEYFRRYVLPRTDPGVFNPYWGGHGVTFRGSLKSLPSGRYEQFGFAANPLAEIAAGALTEANPDDPNVILPVARRSLAAAVDVLWSAAAYVERVKDEARALAGTAEAALRYAAEHPVPAWLATIDSDEALLSFLASAAGADDSGQETFGAEQTYDILSDVLSELVRAAVSASADRVRPALNRSVATFAGDAFTYLSSRERLGAEAPIIVTVLSAFREAQRAGRANGAPLVIVGHSLGGTIAYDILRSFGPDVRCDLLVTVGSQVALMEEMSLLQPVGSGTPSAPGAIAPNVIRWINVFDPVDVFAYAAGPVFEGAEDFEYHSSPNPLRAHGSYFYLPTFYERLRSRLEPDAE